MEIKKLFSGILFFLAPFTLLLVSCHKDGQGTATSMPVVEAYLYTGHLLSVKLYQQKSLTDTAKYGSPITGQQLSVSDGATTIKLSETSKGTYTYSDTTFLSAGKTYTLTFNYLSRNVSAKTTMPTKPQNFSTQHAVVTYSGSSDPNSSADTLNKFTWTNPDSLNHVLVFYNIDDTYLPLGGPRGNGARIVENDTKRKSVYYITSQNFASYGNYRVTLLCVNQEYVNVLNSNTLGSNSNNLLNIPTNVSNGLGIFTAVQADTLYFSLNK